MPYVKPGLIDANVLAGNGGRAVHVFNSVNVDGFFNTAVGNLRTASPVIDDGVELDSNIPGGHVEYYGNVIVPLDTPNTTDATSTYVDNVIAGGTQTVPAGNFDRRSVGAAYLAGDPDGSTVATGLPIDDFTPVRADRVPTRPGIPGYQVLDTGRYRTAGLVPAGALGMRVRRSR